MSNPVVVSKVKPVKQGLDLGGVPPEFVALVACKNHEVAHRRRRKQERKLPQRVDFVAVFRPTPVVPNHTVVSKVNPVKQGSDLGGVPTEFVVSITRENLEVIHWRREKTKENNREELILWLFLHQRQPFLTSHRCPK